MNNISVTNNAVDNALSFLKTLYTGATRGYVTLFLKETTENYAFPIDKLVEAAKKLIELSLKGNVFVARALQDHNPGARSRGTKDTICFNPGLFIEVDTREGPHGSKENPTDPMTLPKDMDEGLKLLAEAGMPKPTNVIHSGGGFHAHYLYESPPMLLTDEDRAFESELSRKFQSVAREKFKAAGYTLDSTPDLARMCRVPATLNHKSTPAKTVQLCDVGERIDRALLVEWLDQQPSTPSKAMATRIADPLSVLISNIAYTESVRPVKPGGPKEDFLSPIIAGCAFMEHTILNAEKLSEPEWHSQVSITCRVVSGAERTHEISKHYPEYTVQETDAKIAHALTASGPATCNHIADRVGFEGCVRCPFRASITSPMNLAKEFPRLVSLQRRFVFVVIGQSYLDLHNGECLKIQEFNDDVQHIIGEKPHSKMMLSSTMPKVRHLEYKAGVQSLIFTGDSGRSANLWMKDGVVPKCGDFDIIERFMEHFIPDAMSRMHLIFYIAHLYQFPWLKITHGIIITGDPGTGKSSWYRIIRRLFGLKNARKMEGDELGNRFNIRLVNVQILLIEEAQHGERLETYEKMKEVVTADQFAAEEKHKSVKPGYTPRGIFISSNHIAPIVLPQNDRRWFVARTRDRPDTVEEIAEHQTFFEEFNEALERNDQVLSAFAHHISTIDLTSFKPNAPPPMTTAKEAAMDDSRIPLANTLKELIDEAKSPLHRDVVSMKDIQYALSLSEGYMTSSTPQKIAHALRSLGLKPVNLDADKKQLELVLPDRTKVRPWAIRDVTRWSNADRESLKAELLRPDPSTFLYNRDENGAFIKLNTN